MPAVENLETERKHLLSVLDRWYKATKDKKAAEGILAILLGTAAQPGVIRKWYDTHPDDGLSDETYIVDAKPTGTGRRFDIMTMAIHHPEAVLKLAELGLLTMSVSAWKAHPRDFIEANVAAGYEMPGGTTLRLSIRKRGE